MKHINTIRRAMALVAVMFFALASAMAQTNYTTYIDVNGNEQKCYSYRPVTDATETLTTGWYLVESDITISSGITVSGAVNLILADDVAFAVTGAAGKAGITVNEGNSLTVYGQAKGNGCLTANGTTIGGVSMGGGAGIGGDDKHGCGTIIINGGIIAATGANGGAGIGGGCNGTATKIKVNRGTVHANGSLAAAGIGAGDKTAAMSIGDLTFSSFESAIAAVQDNTPTTINMIANHQLPVGNTGIVIPNTKDITIDLNGFTLKNAVNTNTASQVIQNKGTLTIKDSGSNGTITNDPGTTQVGEWWSTPQYNYATNVILNQGTLNIESGNIVQSAGGTICYAIDNNSTICNTTVNINGGIIKNEHKSTVRMFCNSTNYGNNITVTNGNIISGKYNIIMQSSNTNANKGNLSVNGGEFTSSETDWPLNIYLYAPDNSCTSQLFMSITGGTFNDKVYMSEPILAKNVSVSNGTFNEFFSESNSFRVITGGTYKVNPSAYVDQCYKAVYNEEQDVYTIDVADFYFNPEDNKYHITNLAGLQEFANSVNNDHVNYSGKTIVLDNNIDMTSAGNWTPIGLTDKIGNSYPYSFQGTFDGNDHKISNLKVTGTNNLGFFGMASDATIKNLNFTNANIFGTGSYAAVVAGSGFRCNIDNVNVSNSTVDVGDGQYVGGIVGGQYTSISECTVTSCNVNGYDQVGGLIGYICGSSITNCQVNESAIEALSERAGGLAGKINIGDNPSTINIDGNKITTTTAKAPDMAGGITAQIMGDRATYTIKNNEIDITCTASAKNPIGCLRDGQNAAFTGSLAANITFNTWTEDKWTDMEKGFVYSNVASGVNPQKIWNVDPYVAKIGEIKYLTLAEAIANATAGQTVEIIKPDICTLPNAINNITIKGDVTGVKFNCVGTGSISSIPNGVTFENVEFDFGQNNYHGFQHAGTINMNGCTLNGKFFSYGVMNFTGCTFNQDAEDYHMWCYGTDVTYKNCEFNGKGKFLHAYCESNSEVYNVTATGCTFNSDRVNKAAVNVKETCGSTMLKYNVVISNCTTNGNFPAVTTFDPLGTLWVIDPVVQIDDRNTNPSTSGITITLDGVKKYPDYVAKNGEKCYFDLHKALEEAVAGETVELLKDVDLNNEEWTPIANFKATFDGNSHTISNLKISQNHQRFVGFFGSVYPSGTIKDLKINGANVAGINHVGAVLGHGMCAKIENCTVKNATITTVVYNNDDGDKAGAICGYLTGEPSAWAKNCHVENCVINGYRDCGSVVGYAGGTNEISGNTVNNVTLNNYQLPNYKNYQNDTEFDFGEVVGEKTGDVTYSNNTATSVTINRYQQQQ